jgi:hypothetical protein
MSDTDKVASVELDTRLQAEITMKWEYLRALVEAHSGSSGHKSSDVPSVIWVFHPDGTIQEWPKQEGEKRESPAVTRLLRYLGNEGWELAGMAALSPTKEDFYFKRPI